MKNISIWIPVSILMFSVNQAVAVVIPFTPENPIHSSTIVKADENTTPELPLYIIGQYQSNVSGLSSQPSTFAVDINTSSLFYRTGNPNQLCPSNYSLDIMVQPTGFGSPPDDGTGNCSLSDASISVINYTVSKGVLQATLQASATFVPPYTIVKGNQANSCDAAAQRDQSVEMHYNLQILCQPTST